MKAILQLLIMFFLTPLLLRYTLAWTLDQPPLPYSTIVIANGVAFVGYIVVMIAALLIAKSIEDE